MENVAKRAGLQVTYICKNGWQDMLFAVENGEGDISALLKSEEREKRVLFSAPIDVTVLSFFTRFQSTMNPSKAPTEYPVGVVRGSMSYEQLKKRPGVNLIQYGSYQDGIFGLLAGEIGLFAGEESMILKRAREARLDDRIKKIGKPFVEQQRGLVVNKGNAHLLGILNKALDDFVGSPDYQQIYLKWYGSPTSYWTAKRILTGSGIALFVAVWGMALWRYQSISRINGELTRNIGERQRAEDALRESEARFRGIYSQSPIAIELYDADGLLVDANPACLELFGVRDVQAVKGFKLFEDPNLPDEVKRRIRAGESTTYEAKFDFELVKKLNLYETSLFGIRYLDCLITPWNFGTNRRSGFLVHIRDVSTNRELENALKESESLLKAFIESSTDVIFVTDLEGRFILVNKAFSENMGRNPEEILGKDVAALFPPSEAAMIMAEDRSIIESASSFMYEHTLTMLNSERRTMQARKGPLLDKQGNVRGVYGISRDITEHKRGEEALRRSEEMTRSVLNSVDEGFIVVDRDYTILTANRAYCGQLGLPLDHVVGKHCFSASHKRDRPCFEQGEECAVKKVFETGNPYTAYHRHQDFEGNILYVETKAFPLKDASGEVISVIESISNITEKHLLEEERLKTQKLEAIGTLAGGIAHDFNNLLQGVFGYISLARLKQNDREKSLAALEEAEKALHMTVKLTNQLLTFSKGGKPVKKSSDLRPIIENAAKFALSGSRSDCRIIADDLWLAEVDDGQIGQVIQNIVLNADQAMPEGGLVEITAKNVRAPGKGLPQRLKEGRYIEIKIKDNGIGIPEQYQSKIFDPYFTTKEKGSGLGLATSYSIMKNHGGLIAVNSAVGQGATFFLYIPAADVVQKAEPVRPARIAAAALSGRILVMDDEQVIRNVAAELITALGHWVEFAENGNEAIEKYEAAKRSGRPFDAVILDLTVRGGMGGAEAVRELKKIDPSVKAVVSSGYSDDSIASNHKAQGFKAFLKKPYNVDSLREVLDMVLQK
jgi:PAS domain S-box-containing protein